VLYRAAWLVLRPQDQQQPDDQQLLSLLTAAHPDLSSAIHLATSFAQIVRQRLADQFDCWLTQAAQSSVVPFQRFALSLQQDYDAIKAGPSLPFSNGPVEGHINRLKTLKRQMYGRASLDLVARRFLLSS
jgi:transposase